MLFFIEMSELHCIETYIYIYTHIKKAYTHQEDIKRKQIKYKKEGR